MVGLTHLRASCKALVADLVDLGLLIVLLVVTKGNRQGMRVGCEDIVATLDRQCGGIECGIEWGCGIRQAYEACNGIRGMLGGDNDGGRAPWSSWMGGACGRMLGSIGQHCRRRRTCMDVDGIGGMLGVCDSVGGVGQCTWTLTALGNVHIGIDDVGGVLGALGAGARVNVGGCGGACGRGGGTHVDDDNVGGVGGMLGGVGGVEVMVVEGRAVVREEKEVGGWGTNLRHASSSFPAVPLCPHDVGLREGILMLWGRWGQSEGMGDGGG
ncbi:hypothetical protein BDN71DRAFT_1436382 [Pleurotus eryngii]|uniref:Uncharacterized protein n=1 Tax=Pleurotus eryngii TaxID=5323 RepID=A0A9P5ZKM2_PLEER|nr:hypothetical protein BDN71DRAFT_1436382 [Pleurotus eryngii]